MKGFTNVIKFNSYKKSSFISIILYSVLFKSIFSSTQLNVDAKYMRLFELAGRKILMCTDKAIYLYKKDQGIFENKKHFNDTVSYEDFHIITI